MELKIGDTVDCVVTKIIAFGIFVSLPDGKEGLIHISELANHPVTHPREVVAVGDNIRAVVLHIDPEKHRIGLSRRQLRQY